MTCIVADTSPICYLLCIDKIDLLPRLYETVIIPQTVRDELEAVGSPVVVQDWIKQPPEWLEIRVVAVGLDPALESLDPGEREAILLAEKLMADWVILDDKAARQMASVFCRLHHEISQFRSSARYCLGNWSWIKRVTGGF
ncbi:hypothetical protein [Spirulina subsalsa]|uniref:hypothetical protein n=1 Tax=Spirulina subsalsa TaxID=54311 RepID=UPI0002D56861|nr:hypothetical protein [Spirulina subsalsa]